MSATAATPDPHRADPLEGCVLPEDPWPAEDPLAADDLWLAEDDTPADRPPGVPEVFKAGRWDRSRCSGGGFAAGGLADHLPPGPVLAGLAADRRAGGLGRLADDELIGILRAARRLASWATAMELAALADLWRRRSTDEDDGDTGAAEHAADEVAAALTLTPHAAGTQLDLAIRLARLPLTSAALASGAIDVPRAEVIADEVTGLTGEHAAAVEQAIVGAAAGQTSGQLRAAAHRAVLAAGPDAARRRKEEAQREARVERWSEAAGTAALAGRDLPPAGVLAADANLTAVATELKAAGVPGTMDTLRAHVYLALLAGTPPAALLPTSPDGATPGTEAPGGGQRGSHGGPGGGRPDNPRCRSGARPADNARAADNARPGGSTAPGDAAGASFATLPTRGSVNLTLPLATWLGHTDEPGHAAGYGPLDATGARDLAGALAGVPGNRWCLTLTTSGGQPLAHGCARTGPAPPSARTTAGPRSRGPGATGPPTTPRPPGQPRAPSKPRRPQQPRAQAVHAHRAPPRTGPGPVPNTWTFILTLLDNRDCGHAWQTPAYQPTARLRHLVQIRHATCVFPGCRHPAKQCDADHTVPYDDGGPTCLCNLAPLCRRHHQAKQAPGWGLAQTSPGTMTWTTPSGRRYTVRP